MVVQPLPFSHTVKPTPFLSGGLVKGQENPLEEEMATHSSFLPGKFMDRRAWQATVYEVAKSQTKLSNQACL